MSPLRRPARPQAVAASHRARTAESWARMDLFLRKVIPKALARTMRTACGSFEQPGTGLALIPLG